MKHSAFILIPFLLLVFLSGAVHAQPDTLWTKTYGEMHRERATVAIRTGDGGYLIGGSGSSPVGDGVRDNYFVVKTDVNGEEEWRGSYGGLRNDDCYGLAQALDGGFLLSGLGDSFEPGPGWIIKIDANGDSIWACSYGGSTYLDGIVPTPDSCFVSVGCNSSRARYGSSDAYLMKIDGEGEIVWDEVYGGEAGEAFHAVFKTDDGGFALAGQTNSFGGGTQFYLVKTDSAGEEEWHGVYGDEFSDRCFSVIQTSDGGYAMGGWTTQEDQADMFLMRIDSEGNEIWTRAYGDRSMDAGRDVIQLEDGGFVFVGALHYDCYAVRTDEDGDVLWDILIEGGGMTSFNAVFPTDDGGYIFAGTLDERGGDYYLVRTEPDPVSAVALPDPSYPSDIILLSPFPNPFNSSTTISYHLPKHEHVTLSIFDLSGREVAVLGEGFTNPGLHTLTWNASGQPTGVYFCRLETGNHSISKKLVITR